jgi:hypothetical protein
MLDVDVRCSMFDVGLRRAHVFVPEQFLDSSDVIAALQEPRRKRMPERMATGGLHDPGQPRRFLHRPLQLVSLAW